MKRSAASPMGLVSPAEFIPLSQQQHLQSSTQHGLASSCLRSPLPHRRSGETSTEKKPPAKKRLRFQCDPENFATRKLSSRDFGRTNDEIHSSIDYCPVMKVIMDTPHVQRLRQLRQLGTSEYTYMNSNHNRFEHSMGVAHLAEQYAEHLRRRQPQLGITDKDILCVKLAGLLHDVGHGPYSHLFEKDFPKELEERLEDNPELKEMYNGYPEIPEGWSHERAGLMVIDAMLKYLGLAINEKQLDRPLKQIGNGVHAYSMRVFKRGGNDQNLEEFDPLLVLTSRDWIFIKELITHTPHEKCRFPVPHEKSGYVGRENRNKEFLYMIVANLFSGLDVDKLDYFARDGRTTFRESGEIQHRFVQECFVAWAVCTNPTKCARGCHRLQKEQPQQVCKRVSGDPCLLWSEPPSQRHHLMICYPEKMVTDAMDLFSIRFKNHSKVYTHKTTQAVTYMIADILALADPFFTVSTQDYRQPSINAVASRGGTVELDTPSFLPISRASLNPNSHLELRDTIIDQISDRATSDPRLRPARDLIRRLRCRDLYKCVAERPIYDEDKSGVDAKLWSMSELEIRNELLQLRGQHEHGMTLAKEDFIVEKRRIHYGAKGDNPVLRMKFLPKYQQDLLDQTVDKLPEARTPYIGAGHCPREFQQRSIRFFARDPQKVELLSHVYQLWNCHHTQDQMEEGFPKEDGPPKQTTLESVERSINEENFDPHNQEDGSLAHVLTQDDEDNSRTSTPTKRSSSLALGTNNAHEYGIPFASQEDISVEDHAHSNQADCIVETREDILRRLEDAIASPEATTKQGKRNTSDNIFR